MAIFPQFEWIEIDGIMVPSVKPQHYKKGSTTETELTGHDNPLPVANYTQNDSGIWLPTSKDNPMPTQVTGSIVELVNVTQLEIEPGGLSILYTGVPDSHITDFFGGVRTNNEHKFRLNNQARLAGAYIDNAEIISDETPLKRAVFPSDNSDEIIKCKRKTQEVRFYITNTSDEIQTYDITISGVG